MEPKYCTKCGKPLEKVEGVLKAGFDAYTGEPVVMRVTFIRCPDSFESSFSEFAFHDAYTIREGKAV